METWRLLVGLCVLLVIWAVLMTVLGYQPGPFDIVLGLVFAVVGLAIGEWLSTRISGGDDG